MPTTPWFPNEHNVHLLLPAPLQECVRIITPLAHILIGHLEVCYRIKLTEFSTLGQSEFGGAGPGATHSSLSLSHSPRVRWVILVSSAACCYGGYCGCLTCWVLDCGCDCGLLPVCRHCCPVRPVLPYICLLWVGMQSLHLCPLPPHLPQLSCLRCAHCAM